MKRSSILVVPVLLLAASACSDDSATAPSAPDASVTADAASDATAPPDGAAGLDALGGDIPSDPGAVSDLGGADAATAADGAADAPASDGVAVDGSGAADSSASDVGALDDVDSVAADAGGPDSAADAAGDAQSDAECTPDDCGVCDFDASNDNTACVQDCAGTWGGDASVDSCGVCDSDPSNDGATCGPQTVVLPVDADTTVAADWAQPQGGGPSVHGGRCSLCAQTTAAGACIGPQTDKTVRAIFRFDLSSIPANATVTAAELTLDVFKAETLFAPANGGSPDLSFGVVFGADNSWNEYQATIADIPPGQYAVVGTMAGLSEPWSGLFTTSSVNLRLQVQEQLKADGLITIFGTGSYCVIFNSKEKAGAQAASLQVTYAVP